MPITTGSTSTRWRSRASSSSTFCRKIPSSPRASPTPSPTLISSASNSPSRSRCAAPAPGSPARSRSCARRSRRPRPRSRPSAARPTSWSARTAPRLSAQQLGEMNAQLGAARTLKADAEAKARLIRQMLKADEEIQSSDVLNSELIRRLSEQRVTLRAQLAEQSSSLLDNHPRIKELQAQIADLDQQIRHEAEIGGALARKRRQARQRPGRSRRPRCSTSSRTRRPRPTSRTCNCARSNAKPSRSAICWNRIWPNIARPPPATASPRRRRMPASFRAPRCRTLPAYPKKLPTVLIATFATFVVCCGIVVTREFLANPATDAAARPVRAVRPFSTKQVAMKPVPATPSSYRCGRARGRASLRDRPLDGAAGCCGERPAADQRAGERDRRIRA